MSLDIFFEEVGNVIVRQQNQGFSDETTGRIDILQPTPKSWWLDLRGGPNLPVQEVRSDDPLYSSPDFVVVCETGDILVEALQGKKEFTTAFTLRQLKIQGNISKLSKFKDIFEPVMRQEVNGSGNSNDELLPMLLPVRKSDWEPDGPACSQCQAKFSLINRRHHCRFCGALCCVDCTRFRLGPRLRRACTLCHLAQRNARVEHEKLNGKGGGGDGDIVMNGHVDSAVTQRLMTLEGRLHQLERARRERKAHTLIQCADMVILSVTISILLCGFLLGHYIALYVQLMGFYEEIVFMRMQSWYEDDVAPWFFNSGGRFATLSPYWLIASLGPMVALLIVCGTLYRRSVTAFSVAAVLVLTIELTKVRVSRRLAVDKDMIWNEAHHVYASYLRLAFFRLKGMYLKLGQYVSSRADLVPEAFSDELSALQDSVPPSHISKLRKTIERTMGSTIKEAFYSFENEALASASIAQVHRAMLKDGTDVVVKVQHPDVAKLLGIDLRNIVIIFNVIGWFEPDYDFSIIANEWSTEVRKELDFKAEGENIKSACEGVKRSGLDVAVPKLITCSSDVIVMTYCPGVKVTDPKAFPEPGAAEDKALYMKTICEIFAYGMYIQGFFSGDPHPGNLMVETVTDSEGRTHRRPVLLDWGLAKRLPDHIRLGNARIVYCAWELDIAGMLDGFRECGMPVEKINILDDLSNIRFMMRNTAPGAESRKMNKQFMEEFVKKAEGKPKSERNPAKLIAPDLLFLARVTEMLQGLGAKLETRVEYLHIMAAACKRALLERPRRPRSPSPLGHDPTPALSFLDRKVRALLQDLIAEGCAVGSQVVLYKNGRMLVNAAGGMRSRLDPVRVTPSTLFCGFSLTKAVLAILAYALIDDQVLCHDTKLIDVWPELRGKGNKDNITLQHILTHSSGLQFAFPEEATPQKIWDPSVEEATIIHAQPITAPGAKVSMHYYSYGWLLVPFLEKASGKSLSQLVKEKITGPLGLDPISLILGPVPGTDELDATEDDRLAHVEYDLRQMLPASMDMAAEGGGIAGPGAGSGLLSLVSDLIDDEEEEEEENDGERKNGRKVNGRRSDGAGGGEERALKDLVGSKLSGREFLLDHRMLNAKKIRATGCLPSLSGHFTARALAEILESFCRAERTAAATATGRPSPSSNGGVAGKGGQHQQARVSSHHDLLLKGSSSARGCNGVGDGHSSSAAAASSPSILSLERLRQMRASPRDDVPSFTRLVGREATIKLASGVQLFEFEPATTISQRFQPLSPCRGGGEGQKRMVGTQQEISPVAYGHAGACGQLALCDPSANLVLVVTSNKAAILGQKNVGYEVLKLVANELNLGKPLPIW